MRRAWLFLTRTAILATAFGAVVCLVILARRAGA
jgi:hypothetical protein